MLRDGEGLACVEVKTGRAGPRFRPGYRMDVERIDRLRRSAAWLARRTGLVTRVDLVEILLDERDFFHGWIHHRGIETPLSAPRR